MGRKVRPVLYMGQVPVSYTHLDVYKRQAYDGLKTNYYNNMYYWTEIRSDNTTLASKTANSGIYNDFDVYNLTSSNAEVQRAWYGMFTCIYRSNVVLDYIDAVPMSDEKKSQYKAEARFLRALSLSLIHI